MNKQALYAMLHGQVTPETANLINKANAVANVTEQKDMNKRFGAMEQRGVTPKAPAPQYVAPQPAIPQIQYAQPTLQHTQNNPLLMNEGADSYREPYNPNVYVNSGQAPQVQVTPDLIGQMLNGQKPKIDRQHIAQPQLMQEQVQMPTSVIASPVPQYAPPAYQQPAAYQQPFMQPVPQLLAEEARQMIKSLAKEELVSMLINEVFSEKRMMDLFESQLEKTLKNILAKKKAAQAK